MSGVESPPASPPRRSSPTGDLHAPCRRIRWIVGNSGLQTIASRLTITVMRLTHYELVGCEDCGMPVAFSAARCPHCGSLEPSGPAVGGPQDLNLHRIEEPKDRVLIGMLVLCSGIGFLYGAATGNVRIAVGYGLLGAIIGVPTGFIINLSRRL